MEGKPSTKIFYKIGEVCRLTDIKPHILRYWESEFPALHPRKNRGGQRVYQQKDLEMVRRIKRMLYEEGYTIAGARNRLSGGNPGPDGSEPGEREGRAADLESKDGTAFKAVTSDKAEAARLADALGSLKREIKELLDIISDK